MIILINQSINRVDHDVYISQSIILIAIIIFTSHSFDCENHLDRLIMLSVMIISIIRSCWSLQSCHGCLKFVRRVKYFSQIIFGAWIISVRQSQIWWRNTESYPIRPALHHYTHNATNTAHFKTTAHACHTTPSTKWSRTASISWGYFEEAAMYYLLRHNIVA